MRDEFPTAVREALFKRAGARCCLCDQVTCGPHALPDKSVRIGIASHIRGASPKGPRYDQNQSAEDRMSAENGIWMCGNHAVLVDIDTDTYTVQHLLEIKASHEAKITSELLAGRAPSPGAAVVPSFPLLTEYMDLLREAQDRGASVGRLCAQALALAIRAGNEEMRAFCDAELNGYSGAPSKLPSYRLVETFGSLAELNMAYIGFAGEPMLAMREMARDTKTFKKMEYPVAQPITTLESWEIPAKGLTRFTMPASVVMPDHVASGKIDGDATVNFYGHGRLPLDVVDGARRRLTGLLLAAVRAIHPPKISSEGEPVSQDTSNAAAT